MRSKADIIKFVADYHAPITPVGIGNSIAFFTLERFKKAFYKFLTEVEE